MPEVAALPPLPDSLRATAVSVAVVPGATRAQDVPYRVPAAAAAVATTAAPGLVKPDGTTVAVAADGTLSVPKLPVSRGGTGGQTPAEARSGLELGGAALLDVGTAAGKVAAGDDARIVGAQSAAQVTSLANASASAAVASEAAARGAADAALAASVALKVTASGGDASATLATAPGSTTARSLAARAADWLNARDFGATGDGTTSDGPALSACAAAAATLGKDMYVPGGNYVCSATAAFVLAPGVTVRADKRAVFLCKSNGNLPSASIHNNGVAGDYTLIGGTLKGDADTNQVYGGHNLFVSNAGTVVLDGVTSRYSRLFGLVVLGCTEALVRGCRVYRSLGDGIAVWDTPNARIVHNHVEAANDDAISAHTNDSAALPRSGVVISDNTIADSQGVRALGAKMVTVENNVMRRMMSFGVYVGAGAGQGNTTAFGAKISGNQISDVYLRPDGRNGAQGYIYLYLGPRTAGAGAAPPGEPAPTTGAVVPLVGSSGVGALYTQAANGAQAGALAVDVTGNTLLRTKPACAAYADWGGAASRWVGDQATSTGGLTTAGIPEANLQTDGIRVTGALRRSRIGWNIIRTSGNSGISLGGATGVANGDFDGLDVVGNDISNFGSFGVNFAQGSLLNHQARVRHNTIDGDPEFRHGNRTKDGSGQPTGAWAAGNGFPAGVWAPFVGDATYEANVFRNVNYPVHHNSQNVLFVLNTYFGNCPALGGYSPTNIGIGAPRTPGLGWLYCQEDADPRSATYGQILAAPTSPLLSAADAASAYAPKANPVLTGSMRLLAGSQAAPAFAGAVHQVAGGDGGNAPAVLDAFGGSPIHIQRRANGTVAAPTALAANDVIADWQARGYGATGYAVGSRAYMRYLAGAAWTDSDQSTLIVWATTPAGSIAPVERVRLSPAGNLLIGTAIDNGTDKLQINGSVSQVPVALTDGATVATDASKSGVFTLTKAVGGALANPTNLKPGMSLTWRITQGAGGNFAMSYGSAFKWAGGAAPSLSTAPGAVDVLTAMCFDGLTLHATLNKAFS